MGHVASGYVAIDVEVELGARLCRVEINSAGVVTSRGHLQFESGDFEWLRDGHVAEIACAQDEVGDDILNDHTAGIRPHREQILSLAGNGVRASQRKRDIERVAGRIEGIVAVKVPHE